jgi:hypothetical protein
MPGTAAKIRLTEKQYNVLQQISRSTIAPQRLVQRVGVILMSFSGLLNMTIADELGLGALCTLQGLSDRLKGQCRNQERILAGRFKMGNEGSQGWQLAGKSNSKLRK